MARSSLKGSAEFRARLRAIKGAFKPVGRSWAEDTVELAKPGIHSRTGKTRASIRVRNASQRKATVVGRFSALFLDRGTKPYDFGPRKAKALAFPAGGRTIFSRKAHKPRQEGTHFAQRAAREALRRNPMAETLIGLWNRAR